MMKTETAKYTVVRDTREKKHMGWYFQETERCQGTVEKKLDVGDYSILGFENLVTLERKGAVAEFCTNLNQPRFIGPYKPGEELSKQSEMIRLEAIKWPFILLEFTLEDLLKYPNIPEVPPRLRKAIYFKGHAALKRIIELEMQFKTRIIFCGPKAKDVAASIFKRVVEEIERKNG